MEGERQKKNSILYYYIKNNNNILFKFSMMKVGFEPTPRKNSTLNCRLRPLGHFTKKAPPAGLEPATLR